MKQVTRTDFIIGVAIICSTIYFSGGDNQSGWLFTGVAFFILIVESIKK
jgi:hypothetical protein